MSTPKLLITSSEDRALKLRKYKLIKILGEGSYAKVYLAEFTGENKNNLACKVVDTVLAPKDFVVKFLPRELDILLKINHPHIVHVHSIFQRKAKYFIFMRFAEGGDLLNYIMKHGNIVENQARVWMRQLALALQYLHEMEIAHRDIKCENILITNNFNVKLADFGFARYVIDHNAKSQLSQTYCGSLSYVAPEILSANPYNPKISDVWSLGIVLYIMLNNAMPFDDVYVKKLYENQMAKRWRFRSKVVNILSNEVKQVVIGMLDPNANTRWRINQVLTSDWVAMDSRLQTYSQAEQSALSQATEERKKLIEEEQRKMKAKQHNFVKNPPVREKYSPSISVKQEKRKEGVNEDIRERDEFKIIKENQKKSVVAGRSSVSKTIINAKESINTPADHSSGLNKVKKTETDNENTTNISDDSDSDN